MQIKILVIDDEEYICEILKYNLEKEGYTVDTALSAEDALTMDLESYSLFIVDIMMERLSGFDFAKRLRSTLSTENTPIIFCSALNDEDDTVMGLNIGADDYITKPFVIGEVMARVRAVLRRSQISRRMTEKVTSGHYETDINFNTMRIDRNDKVAYIDGEEVKLTKTEYELLLFFLTHRNRIYSREDIMKEVWDNEAIISSRAIDTNITRLRKKIGEYGSHIVTRTGFGYGFKETD